MSLLKDPPIHGPYFSEKGEPKECPYMLRPLVKYLEEQYALGRTRDDITEEELEPFKRKE